MEHVVDNFVGIQNAFWVEQVFHLCHRLRHCAWLVGMHASLLVNTNAMFSRDAASVANGPIENKVVEQSFLLLREPFSADVDMQVGVNNVTEANGDRPVSEAQGAQVGLCNHGASSMHQVVHFRLSDGDVVGEEEGLFGHVVEVALRSLSNVLPNLPQSTQLFGVLSYHAVRAAAVAHAPLQKGVQLGFVVLCTTACYFHYDVEWSEVLCVVHCASVLGFAERMAHSCACCQTS